MAAGFQCPVIPSWNKVNMSGQKETALAVITAGDKTTKNKTKQKETEKNQSLYQDLNAHKVGENAYFGSSNIKSANFRG